jgi:hypothetical protein
MDVRLPDGTIISNVPDGTTQTELMRRVQLHQKTQKPEPSNMDVAIQALNKGFAGSVDSIIHTPAHLWNLAKAGVGTAVGMAGGSPDYMPDPTPLPHFTRRLFDAVGSRLKAENEPQTRPQRVLASTVEALGGGLATPATGLSQVAVNVAAGGLSGLISGTVQEATGNKTLAALAGMAAPAGLQVAAQKSKAAVLAKELEKQQNSVRDANLKAAQEKGYKINPSAVRPDSAINNTLESIAGKAAVKQEAQVRNQPVTNRLAAEELRMPPGTAMEESGLKAFRDQQAWPYREASAISKTAELTVERLKQARFDKQEQYNYYKRSGDPAAGREARRLEALEGQLESRLTKIVTQAGKPQLVDDLKAARKEIAKSYSVGDVVNKGDANVSAPALAAALQRDDALSGNLATIAKFALGPGRQVVQEGSKVQAPGVSALNPMMAATLGTQGAAAAGAPGMFAAGIPLLRGPARNLVLSDTYQKLMANPNYSPGMIKTLLAKLPADQQQAVMQALQSGQRSASLANALEGQP